MRCGFSFGGGCLAGIQVNAQVGGGGTVPVGACALTVAALASKTSAVPIPTPRFPMSAPFFVDAECRTPCPQSLSNKRMSFAYHSSVTRDLYFLSTHRRNQ